MYVDVDKYICMQADLYRPENLKKQQLHHDREREVEVIDKPRELIERK